MQPSAIKAFWSTYKEVLDSKKWVGSYIATALAVCLVQFLHWSITDAMAVSGFIGLAVVSQAHVDAQTAQASGPAKVDAPVQNVTVNPEPPK